MMQRIERIPDLEDYRQRILDTGMNVKIYDCRQNRTGFTQLPAEIKKEGERGGILGRGRSFGRLVLNLEYLRRGLQEKDVEMVYEHDEGVKAKLNEESRIVFLVHGLKMGPGTMRRLAVNLKDEGFSPITIGYNSRFGFGISRDSVAFGIDKIMKEFRGRYNKVYALGHSMGGDILRMNAHDARGTRIDGYVFSDACINGAVPKLWQSVIFGDLNSYCDPRNKQGFENIMELKVPVQQPSINVASVYDKFVPLESAFDFFGVNAVHYDRRLGHIAGIGADIEMNYAYTEYLNFVDEWASGLSGQKSLRSLRGVE